jgi:hypothetical protein
VCHTYIIYDFKHEYIYYKYTKRIVIIAVLNQVYLKIFRIDCSFPLNIEIHVKNRKAKYFSFLSAFLWEIVSEDFFPYWE